MSNHTHPIEVRASQNLPLGMPTEAFLQHYWQKHPLLIRQAFAHFESPITADDLAGLACEPMALSRLIQHDRTNDDWTVKHGPLDDHDFAQLPERDWTILVQDCDKLLGDIEPLLKHFRFIPSWRIDDIMISYAVAGGSVGAHTDQYDVFLLQAHGHRQWQISATSNFDGALRDDVELKMLRSFSPDHDWVLAPGDMLYLPPNIAHHGVAQDACLTFSIGMRAPALSEMLIDFAEQQTEVLSDTQRYTDPNLAQPQNPAEIDDLAIAQVHAQLQYLLTSNPHSIRDWFAGFITRYRSAHTTAPAETPITSLLLREHLKRDGALYRCPWSRYAFVREADAVKAWFAGQSFICSLSLAVLLQDHTRIDNTQLRQIDTQDMEALTAMINSGHLVLDDESN
jgi:50S ribosomal protein L16 3-hydroxylase